MTAPEALTASPGYRIVEFQAENFMRLRAVDITPDGTLQVIEGANAQGKSSVLDAIFYALAGGSAQRGITEVIHHDERSAKVRLTLSDGEHTIIVTRRWARNGDAGTLKVTDGNGTPFTETGRALLDRLIAERCFDPLAFANAKAADQRATLLSLVKLPFDPDELDRERQGLYEQRTEANREVKRLDAVVESLPIPAADAPDTEVSTAELAAEYAKAQAEITAANQAIDDRELLAQQVALMRTELAAAEARLEATPLVDLETLPDVDAIATRMANADTLNAAARAKRARNEAKAQATAAAKQAAALDEAITAIDERKAKALAEATMPLPGLSFDTDGVTYQGVPFTQASGAERLRVSVAMGIAANPTVRTMVVHDGPLLDADGMALLRSMAEANDFQMFVERVYSGGEREGVLIVDGQVADTGGAPTITEAPAATPAELDAWAEAVIDDPSDAFGWLDTDGSDAA